MRISVIGLPVFVSFVVLFPALSILRLFGGVEHAPPSSHLVGSVSSSILVHN